MLTCEENLRTSTSSQRADTVSPRVISRLTISRDAQPSAKGSNEEIESQRHIAVLTRERPKLVRVSDGFKLDGVLEAHRATLRLEMVKAEDCLAQYICQVRTSDSQGSEFVQTGRLRQGYHQRDSMADDGSMTSAGSLQQLALLQQQVTLLGASLGDKLGVLSVKMEALDGKVSGIDARLDSRQGRLEDKILSVKDAIESLKDEMNNKIESRVVEKLCQMEARLPRVEDAVADTSDSAWASLKEQLIELNNEQQKSIMLNIEATLNSTNEIKSVLQDHKTETSTTQKKRQMKYDRFIANMQTAFSTGNEVCLQVRNEISSFQTNFQSNFDILKKAMRNSSEEKFAIVQDLTSAINLTISKTLKPAMSEVFNPKVCRRDMDPVVSGSLYPYLVVRPGGDGELDVPFICDTGTDSGGWIIVQRRTTGNVDFYRNWNAYKVGFGRLDDDFWLGNAHIHALTATDTYELRVDLGYKGKYYFAHYEIFSLGSEEDGFTLRLGKYDGTAPDMFSYHKGRQFTTFDRDGDGHSSNCAVSAAGAWWYGACYHSNLNGRWATNGDKGMQWVDLTKGESVIFSEMKIRRV